MGVVTPMPASGVKLASPAPFLTLPKPPLLMRILPVRAHIGKFQNFIYRSSPVHILAGVRGALKNIPANAKFH